MKKKDNYLIICFVILLLCGCSTENKEDLNDPITSTTELNAEEILEGNFSSIAGEYININGKIIFLDDDGLSDNEKQTGEIYGSLDSGFFMGIHQKEIDDAGYLLSVFPVGVEVPNLEGLTDTTKIRICYGQADPMSVEEVYTKK